MFIEHLGMYCKIEILNVLNKYRYNKYFIFYIL